MRTLQRTFSRFDEWLVAENGLRFRGVIQPSKEGVGSLTNFLETRLVLHVRHKEPVQVGMVVQDGIGRRFLTAIHDEYDHTRVLKLFPVTSHVSWKREQVSIEPVTGLSKGTGQTELGPIWVAVEIYGREEVERATHIGMDRSRVLVGADVKLNDLIDGRMVRRLNEVYGIKVVEIQ